MRYLLTLLCLFLISTSSTFAACGFRGAARKQNTRQKSSVIIPEDTKNFKKFATISKKHAKKFAVSHYPGKVKKAKLIKEENTLVWKLEVQGNQGRKEVFIDPSNGMLLGFGLTK